MSENVQLGNVPNGAPESAPMSSDGFFEALDTQVNGGILDAPPSQEQTTSQSLEDAGNQFLQEQQQKESPVEGQADIENLQKRYSDSSREAQRLNGKLTELEPYMPILDAMREDPNLITHVRNYFQGGGQAPVSMKEQLNLNEDFVFDPDEAMSNADSDSAKVLGATIDGVVQKRLNDALSTQKSENIRLTKESEFRSKYNLSEDQWKNFVSFAKNKTLQLDDIYYLMNKGQREQNIAQSANQEVTNQMKKVQQRPQSLASQGSASEPQKSPDDSVFEEILGIDTTLENVLGR
jgi:DNA-binding transcriptional MerR regulator